MPIRHNVGQHPNSTPKKQEALDGLAGHLLGSTGAIAQKWGKQAVVLDMTCGYGIDDEGNEGSPLIFARHIVELRKKGYTIDLICVDRSRRNLKALQAAMQQLYPDLSVHYEADQRVALANLPAKAVGLSYFDPTHYADLEPDILSYIGDEFEYLDILFTRQCQAYYRMRGAPHTASWTLSPQDYLNATMKKCRYVVEYATYNRWMFGFADNWEKRPEGKLSWSVKVQSQEANETLADIEFKMMLWNVRTPQGQLVLKRLMKQPPEEEPPCEQMPLFGFDE